MKPLEQRIFREVESIVHKGTKYVHQWPDMDRSLWLGYRIADDLSESARFVQEHKQGKHNLRVVGCIKCSRALYAVAD